jgi:alpha-beta hydrolase superfamily lysophospholipase
MTLRGNQLIASFKNNEDQYIFYRHWNPSRNRKGIVIIVHGFNSHSAYYQDFALQLTENNFEVYAIDLRGRGLSDGERYYIGDYRDVLDDINLLANIAKAIDPAIPVFLLGHCAGGVFSSVYALLYEGKLQGLIAESFALQVPASALALATLKFFGYIVPYLRLFRIKNLYFSRDRDFVTGLEKDAFLMGERQPARTMQQLLFASALLKRDMHKIKLPLLILHGTADKATRPEGSEYFMEHAGSADKQLKLYEGYYHDLLHDKNNMIVSNDIITWLNERT